MLSLIVAPCSFEVSEISDFQAINSPDRTLADLTNDEAAIERVYLEFGIGTNNSGIVVNSDFYWLIIHHDPQYYPLNSIHPSPGDDSPAVSFGTGLVCDIRGGK